MNENTTAKIAAAEAGLIAKYNQNRQKVVPGSVRQAKGKAEQEKYGNKLLCTVNTVGVNGKPDGKTRVVATSDVWQIEHQPEVKETLRKQQRNEAKKNTKQGEAKKSKPKSAKPKENVKQRKARLLKETA